MRTVATSRLVLSFGLALTLISRAVIGAPPEIIKHNDGWYKQRFKSVGVAYLADTIGRTCYSVTSGGMTEIYCKTLKRRPEWSAIITWERRIKSSD